MQYMSGVTITILLCFLAKTYIIISEVIDW